MNRPLKISKVDQFVLTTADLILTTISKVNELEQQVIRTISANFGEVTPFCSDFISNLVYLEQTGKFWSVKFLVCKIQRAVPYSMGFC